MLRPSAVLLFAVLAIASAACRREARDPVTEAARHAPTLPCALAGAATFARDCTVERLATPDGQLLVIHHPDGGFRRLRVATDGRGVVSADGAQEATVSVLDPGTIEVAVAGDRYRLPATVKGEAPPR